MEKLERVSANHEFSTSFRSVVQWERDICRRVWFASLKLGSGPLAVGNDQSETTKETTESVSVIYSSMRSNYSSK